MICGDEGDDFAARSTCFLLYSTEVCGYPMYADSKTREPYVLELYRARGAAAKDLLTNRLRHNALSILRPLLKERKRIIYAICYIEVDIANI